VIVRATTSAEAEDLVFIGGDVGFNAAGEIVAGVDDLELQPEPQRLREGEDQRPHGLR
jgi:hypothetical protein